MSRMQFTGAGRLLFLPTLTDPNAPTVAELTGGTTVELTGAMRQDGLNRSQEAALVDTATALDLFDTTDIGTRSGRMELTLYRDSTDDDAWDALPIGTRGYFIVAPFGFTGADDVTTGLPKPLTGDKIEVWQVAISNRSNAAIGKDTAQTFSVTCAVSSPPKDDVVIAA